MLYLGLGIEGLTIPYLVLGAIALAGLLGIVLTRKSSNKWVNILIGEAVALAIAGIVWLTLASTKLLPHFSL